MKSMISDSLDEPAAPKAMGLMRNDHSCCHGSNSEPRPGHLGPLGRLGLTSPWEVGVGGPKKLLHVVRDEAEAEDAHAGARAALRGRG